MSTTQTEENKRLIRRLYDECINPGRLELLDELLSSDFIASPGETGAAEFANVIAAVRRGFPDVIFEVDDLIAEGDRVAVRWTFHGTHQGTFASVPASQAKVTQTANIIYRVADGKITRAWVQVDRLGLLQQIRPA